MLEVTAPVRGRFSGRGGEIGATDMHLTLDESVAYVEAVYDDYLRYAQVSTADLDSARVLEVGAGDNFAVALKLLAAGAEDGRLRWIASRPTATPLSSAASTRP